jgi:hypothetical protein
LITASLPWVAVAACFIKDIGTVLALGLVFANYNFWLVGFALATLAAMFLLPRVTPWFFARLGSLVRADVIVDAADLIVIHLAVKMITKFVGILPLTRIFRFERREGMYTTLMVSTGLTFGSISALFG